MVIIATCVPLSLSHPRIDGTWTFPWEVTPGVSLQVPSGTIYKNLSTPRGLVLIFNYHFSGQSKRFGAHRDSFNLKTLFITMGYHVHLHEDLTKQQTLDALKATQQDPQLWWYDSFIVIVMSHGKDDLLFYTSDGLHPSCSLSLADVRSHFLDNVCSFLKGKPKIFLANFCRGEVREQPNPLLPHYDAVTIPQQEAPRDMITIYSCINTFQSMRDPVKGTLFVQALCEVLAEHAHDKELSELYLLLCDNMHRKKGTTPEQQNYAFGKFFFNPIDTAST